MYVFKSNHSQHDRLVHYQESHLMYIDPAFRVSSVRHDPAPTHARRFNMTFAMNRSQRREFIRNNLTGFPLAPHPPVAFNQGVPMNRLWREGLMEVRPSPSPYTHQNLRLIFAGNAHFKMAKRHGAVPTRVSYHHSNSFYQ